MSIGTTRAAYYCECQTLVSSLFYWQLLFANRWTDLIASGILDILSSIEMKTSQKRVDTNEDFSISMDFRNIFFRISPQESKTKSFFSFSHV